MRKSVGALKRRGTACEIGVSIGLEGQCRREDGCYGDYVRLVRYFGTSPQHWLNLQTAHDLEVAEQEISAAD
jgi:nitrogen regulatory protein PII-like uncharacterized protein